MLPPAPGLMVDESWLTSWASLSSMLLRRFVLRSLGTFGNTRRIWCQFVDEHLKILLRLCVKDSGVVNLFY